jgi:predicted porin
MGFYGGVKSATYGQLTYGRQNTPLKENFYRYDPLGNAAAFSAFGAYGTPAGGGSTENARLNNSLRYQVDLGRVHVDTLYAGPTTAQGGSGWQLGAGSKFDRLSVDGVYTEKKRAVVAAPLGIVGTVPAKSAATSVYWLTHTPPQSNLNAGYEYAAINSVSSNDALAGTVSDNKAWALFAKYDFGGPIVYAGYERITYSDPSSPRSAGFDSIGGYTFAVINNAAYATDKVLETKWIGLKYPVTPKLDLLTAAYRYEQNSYTGNACTVPAATAPGTTVSVNQNNPCSSGTQRSYTMAVDYKLNKYFDLYTGIMASNLSGGLASGFAHTSVYNAMAGIRMKF